jgi:hypothetical protein
MRHSSVFNDMVGLDGPSIREIQKGKLANLIRSGWNPNAGSPCRTSSGRSYVYGPNFIDQINAWQSFVLGTRGLGVGAIYHYSHLDDPSASAWTDYVSRHRVRLPLDEASARRMARVVNETPLDVAVIMSGALLCDLLLWADAADVSLFRPTIFTTFEIVPPSLTDRLLRSFPDWCDYMRSWDGGLTFWRCREGRYHTMDISTILRVESDGAAIVTDLTNHAQRFADYRTGDLVECLPEHVTCACGAPCRNLRYVRSSSWDFVDRHGDTRPVIEDATDLPPGVQVYQRRPGEVVMLRPDGWDEASASDPAVLKVVEGWKASFAKGCFRRREKKLPVFSSVASGRRLVDFCGGYEHDLAFEFEALA